MAVLFDSSDDDYRQWLADNPAGFVLNTYRNPTPNYAVLHRAGCGQIRSIKVKSGAYTEGDYVKFCAQTVEDLKAKLRNMTSDSHADFSKPCGSCNPA